MIVYFQNLITKKTESRSFSSWEMIQNYASLCRRQGDRALILVKN